MIIGIFMPQPAWGAEPSAAIIKPLMASGMITIVAYAVAARYLDIRAGLNTGTILSVLIFTDNLKKITD